VSVTVCPAAVGTVTLLADGVEAGAEAATSKESAPTRIGATSNNLRAVIFPPPRVNREWRLAWTGRLLIRLPRYEGMYSRLPMKSKRELPAGITAQLAADLAVID
jgi:hypothetical protein